MVIRSAIAVIAAITRGAGVKNSCEVNRAARIIRNGSSLNDCSGVPGVSITSAARWARPPYGSTNRLLGSSTAIAFTVKSRRTRSPSSVSPKRTCGLRLSAT